jgi:hypothetical protein
MTREDGTIQIRSFRNCFRLERRIHKIDRWRIPVPFGIPLRGLGYALAVAFAVLVLGRLPVTGLVLGALPSLVRFVVLPIAAAYVLARWELDGRPAHAVLRSWALMRIRPTRIVGWRRAEPLGPVTLGQVAIAPDERGAVLRTGVIEGPARVVVRYPFKPSPRGRTLRIVPEPGGPRWRGTEIALRAGQRLLVR